MKNKTSILIAMVVWFGLVSAVSCGPANNKPINNESKKQAAHTVVVGSSDTAKSFAKELEKIGPAADLSMKAERYYNAGQYNLAIATCHEVLAMKPNYGITGFTRSILEDAYTAKGEYELALKEIDWQLSQHPYASNPSHFDRVLARKQNLEKLLAEKNPK